MPRGKHSLHGNAPDSCPLALLLVDVINDLEFPEADRFLETALPAARRMAKVTREARRLRIPVVYANDNFGRWRSNLHAVVEHCTQRNVRGHSISRLLKPRRLDYLVLKPKHSAFFATTLELLLRYLEVNTLVLMGFAGNICVLFTANDLYLRDYRVLVPEDCCASNTPQQNESALEQMRTILRADTRSSSRLDLRAELRRARKNVSERRR